jgi:hypothetical protein
MTKQPKPIKAVMTEYLNDNNSWEWYSVNRTTPDQAICTYLFEVDAIDDDTKITFKESDGKYYCDQYEDVRAYYITIN